MWLPTALTASADGGGFWWRGRRARVPRAGPSQPSRGANRCLGAQAAFGMRGDVILGAVKRALRRTRAAVQRGRRPSAVLIGCAHSRALWAGWCPRVRRQGARESVGARSLTRTRLATGSATAMISAQASGFQTAAAGEFIYSWNTAVKY